MRRRKSSSSSSQDYLEEKEVPMTFVVNTVGSASLLDSDADQVNSEQEGHEEEGGMNEKHELPQISHLHHHDFVLDADHLQMNALKSRIKQETRELCLRQDQEKKGNNDLKGEQQKDSPSSCSFSPCNFVTIEKQNREDEEVVVNNDMDSSKSRVEGENMTQSCFYPSTQLTHPSTSTVSSSSLTFTLTSSPVASLLSNCVLLLSCLLTVSLRCKNNNNKISSNSSTAFHFKRSNSLSCNKSSIMFTHHVFLVLLFSVNIFLQLPVTTIATHYHSVVPTSYSRSDLLSCDEVFKTSRLPCLCSRELIHPPATEVNPFSHLPNGSLAVICDGVSFFGDFPSLPFKSRIHTFSQRNSFIQSLEPQLFTASSVPLLRIDFSHNRLRRLMERIFDGVESSLLELDMSHNLLGDQLNPIFSTNEFLHLRNLRSLDLSYNELRALDNNLLKGLKNLTVSVLKMSSLSAIYHFHFHHVLHFLFIHIIKEMKVLSFVKWKF